MVIIQKDGSGLMLDANVSRIAVERLPPEEKKDWDDEDYGLVVYAASGRIVVASGTEDRCKTGVKTLFSLWTQFAIEAHELLPPK